ncbi:MAG: pyridoxine 5-phosphate synthase [Chlamydiales bacterium]|jgi:pyridoxine 5-phosphate synthase
MRPRLHVNIDHVATLRQARMEAFPDPVEWALAAERAGVQGITCHLRADRRHIQDDDVVRLRESIKTLLNLEISLADEIVGFAIESGADAFCVVPENRKEITTEGGLDVKKDKGRLIELVPELAKSGAQVSLFIDPDFDQIDAAAETGATFIELHTGRYANTADVDRRRELERLQSAASYAQKAGLRVNAGHGLDYKNVGPVAHLPNVEELNIGFAIVARGLMVGVAQAIGEMRTVFR